MLYFIHYFIIAFLIFCLLCYLSRYKSIQEKLVGKINNESDKQTITAFYICYALFWGPLIIFIIPIILLFESLLKIMKLFLVGFTWIFKKLSLNF